MPGISWGWKANISVSQCEVASEGFLTKRLRCSAKLSPDTAFPIRVESGLSITLFVELPRDKNYVRMSFIVSNSSTDGSYDVPFKRLSVQAKVSGNPLAAFGHTYTFRGKSTPYESHTIQSNGRIDFFPELSGSDLHAIPEDFILSSADYVISLGSLGTLGQTLANVTRAFVPQSESGVDLPDHSFNWLENSPVNVKVPNAKAFYSNAELRARDLNVRASLLADQTSDGAGNPFAFDSIHPLFPLHLAGMGHYGTAGGWGIQFSHEVNTLLANGGMNGHREVIEAAQAFTRAQNNRFKVSVMYDEFGRLLTAEELLSKANGEFVHAANNWHLHYASRYNPNAQRQQESDVQTLQDLAISNCPYARELFGYYELNSENELVWRNSVYVNGGTDRQHSVRFHPLGILGCLQVPTESCLQTLETLGNAIYAFRNEGNGPVNLGTSWENNLREARQDATQGIFGSVIGKRDNTDLMFATLGLQLRENPGSYIQSRIALFSQVVVENMSGQSVITSTRKLDGRDYDQDERKEILRLAASQYNFSLDPYLFMEDEAARQQYCTWDAEHEKWIDCHWPAPHTCYPSCALINKINNEGVKVQSTWEGVYSANSIQHLLLQSKDLTEISSYTEPAIRVIQEHLRAFNNTCEGNMDYKQCGFGPDGEYGWLRVIGRPLNPFPNATIHRLAKFSGSASKYMYMSAIGITINFETDPVEGYQTWQKIYPSIAYSRENVFDQWNSNILAWYQTFAALR